MTYQNLKTIFNHPFQNGGYKTSFKAFSSNLKVVHHGQNVLLFEKIIAKAVVKEKRQIF